MEQLEDFCRRLYPSPGPGLPPPQASLTHVLQRFMALAQLSPSGHYFLCHSRYGPTLHHSRRYSLG